MDWGGEGVSIGIKIIGRWLHLSVRDSVVRCRVGGVIHIIFIIILISDEIYDIINLYFRKLNFIINILKWIINDGDKKIRKRIKFLTSTPIHRDLVLLSYVCNWNAVHAANIVSDIVCIECSSTENEKNCYFCIN